MNVSDTFKSLETSHEVLSEGSKQGAYYSFLFPRVLVLRLKFELSVPFFKVREGMK